MLNLYWTYFCSNSRGKLRIAIRTKVFIDVKTINKWESSERTYPEIKGTVVQI